MNYAELKGLAAEMTSGIVWRAIDAVNVRSEVAEYGPLGLSSEDRQALVSMIQDNLRLVEVPV